MPKALPGVRLQISGFLLWDSFSFMARYARLQEQLCIIRGCRIVPTRHLRVLASIGGRLGITQSFSNVLKLSSRGRLLTHKLSIAGWE